MGPSTPKSTEGRHARARPPGHQRSPRGQRLAVHPSAGARHRHGAAADRATTRPTVGGSADELGPLRPPGCRPRLVDQAPRSLSRLRGPRVASVSRRSLGPRRLPTGAPRDHGPAPPTDPAPRTFASTRARQFDDSTRQNPTVRNRRHRHRPDAARHRIACRLPLGCFSPSTSHGGESSPSWPSAVRDLRSTLRSGSQRGRARCGRCLLRSTGSPPCRIRPSSGWSSDCSSMPGCGKPVLQHEVYDERRTVRRPGRPRVPRTPGRRRARRAPPHRRRRLRARSSPSQPPHRPRLVDVPLHLAALRRSPPSAVCRSPRRPVVTVWRREHHKFVGRSTPNVWRVRSCGPVGRGGRRGVRRRCRRRRGPRCGRGGPGPDPQPGW